MVDVVNSDQNVVFEDVENDSFENMVEIANEPDAECIEEMRSDYASDGKIICLNQTFLSFKR